jgi:PAS domain-containing protein
MQPSELAGQSVFDFFAAVDRQRAVDELESLQIGSVSSLTVERRLRSGDNVESWCQLSAWRLDESSSRMRILRVKDITVRRELHAAHRHIFEMLAGNRPTWEILHSVCMVGEKAISSAHFAILPLGGEAHWGDPTAPSKELLSALEHSGVILAGVKARIETSLPGELIPAESALLLLKGGITSIVSDPIRATDGIALGILVICLRNPMAWAADEMEIRDECAYLARVVFERFQKDERAAAKDQLTNALLESTSDCVNFLTPDGRIEYMNGPGLAALGICDFASIKGFDWLSFWSGEFTATAARAVEDARAGGTGRFQGVCRAFEGEPRW